MTLSFSGDACSKEAVVCYYGYGYSSSVTCNLSTPKRQAVKPHQNTGRNPSQEVTPQH